MLQNVRKFLPGRRPHVTQSGHLIPMIFAAQKMTVGRRYQQDWYLVVLAGKSKSLVRMRPARWFVVGPADSEDGGVLRANGEITNLEHAAFPLIGGPPARDDITSARVERRRTHDNSLNHQCLP